MGRSYKILFLVIILEITATFIINVASTDYCRMRTCLNPAVKLHTGCIFRVGELGPQCDFYNVISNNLNDSEKAAIVSRHNELRKYVAAGLEWSGKPGPQPTAATFSPDLSWDDELALLAQTWANQCLTIVDGCRDVERFQVNQIQYYYTSDDSGTLISADEFIDRWYDRVHEFDHQRILNYKYDEFTSYYTQIVWANTTKIGCGQITLGKKQIHNEKHHLRLLPLENQHYARIFVCNYGPGGNVNGEKVYNPA